MSSREGFDSYQLYLAVKLHFKNEDYDFIKYNARVKADLSSFMKRNDKFHFAKLSRTYKHELKDFYVANLSQGDYWAGELLEKEAQNRFTEYKKRKQKLSHMFEQEVKELLEKKTIQEVLTCSNGQHPYLLKQFLGKKISIETMCILNDITDYSITWNKLIKENIVYPDTYHKIKKYRTFLSYDFKQYKQKLIELCST
jgi:hypothetical protein|tara:strand:+ start:5850 stop:6443 length:594 start_codon:yes stop_codon:yes gene_type:complete